MAGLVLSFDTRDSAVHRWHRTKMNAIKLNSTGWTDLCAKACEPAWQGLILVGADETEKDQKRAKMTRKGATKMGPHQADWGLKAALNENEHHKAELDRLDGLVRESVRTCMAGTGSGGCN